MEKNCGIFVVKRLHLKMFLYLIWTRTLPLKNILDCGRTWNEF